MDCVTQADVIEALTELAGVRKIAFYTSSARKTVYGCFPNWAEHQRVRDSKQKCPDPDDTTVNDWYLQRFIPLDLKVEIIERDGFKCQSCGKFITSDRDAKRLAKHGNGMYHIDHIVPVGQGGRASKENLRLTCSACNLKRKKCFSFREILEFAKNGDGCDNSPQVAASCRELRPESNPNPIQSESISESNTDSGDTNAPTARKRFTPPTLEEVRAYCQDRQNSVNPQRFVDYYTSNGWMVGKNRMKDWKAAVRNWEQKDKPLQAPSVHGSSNCWLDMLEEGGYE
jgi:5-methylcytosine-specific restriction endonuclease McrA